MAEVGCGCVERVMNAKGRWPLRASGMPTTQHSATAGWEEIACSIEPVLIMSKSRVGRKGKVIRTCAKSMSSDIDDIV